LRLFAGYREKVGRAEVSIELPEDATVGHLAEEVLRRHPGLARDPERLVVAVNHEYRDHSHTLNDGDEVALIPPVSGGGNDRDHP
jgi:molybdopterin converting factor subunit 1